MTSFILQPITIKQQPRNEGMGSHKNTNANSTKHISSPKSDKCLPQITSKCRCFQTIVNCTCNCNNTTVPHCFSLSSQFPDYNTVLYLSKLTISVLHCIRLLFYIEGSPRHQISLLSFRCSHSQDKPSPSKMYSHRTSRPKSLPKHYQNSSLKGKFV